MNIVHAVTIIFLANNIFCTVLLASENEKPIITDLVMIVHNTIYTKRETGADYIKVMDAFCHCDGKKIEIKPVNDECTPIYYPMNLFSENNNTLKDNIRIKLGGGTYNVRVKMVKGFIPAEVRLNNFKMIKISEYKSKWWPLGITYPTNVGDMIPGVRLDVIVREPRIKYWSESLPYEVEESKKEYHIDAAEYTFPLYVPQSLFFADDGTLKEEAPLIFFNVGNDHFAAKLIVNFYTSKIFREEKSIVSFYNIVKSGIFLAVIGGFYWAFCLK